MKTFEDLSSDWTKQRPEASPIDLNEVQRKINLVSSKQRVTILVLLSTVVLLLIYTGLTLNPFHIWFAIGLGLMIGSVVYRLVLEVVSRKKLRSLPVSENLMKYSQRLGIYQKWRLGIHQIHTPIVLFLYWTGFLLLIPTLKLYLSHFWFNYVWISSIPIAVAMLLFIAYHIKKERQRLEELQSLN